MLIKPYDISYAILKEILLLQTWMPLYVTTSEINQAYAITGGDGKAYSTFMLENEYEDCFNTFADRITEIQKVDDGIVLSQGLRSILPIPKTIDGKPIIATSKTDAIKIDISSYNWANKSTWYQTSTLVENDICQRISPTVYKTAFFPVIDASHGKIPNEFELLDYKLIVKVDNALQSESLLDNSEFDFTFNYSNGEITFENAIDESAEVTATYFKPNDSIFTFKPRADKSLSIADVIARFSTDIQITDSIIYEVYGYAIVFDPLSVANNEKLPTDLVLVSKFVYKTFNDFIASSTDVLPTLPVISANTSRGNTVPLLGIKWKYISSTPLIAKYGMEGRLYLENNNAFDGTIAFATFNCLEENFE